MSRLASIADTAVSKAACVRLTAVLAELNAAAGKTGCKAAQKKKNADQK